jgi:hypothetical protein
MRVDETAAYSQNISTTARTSHTATTTNISAAYTEVAVPLNQLNE